MARKIGRNDPCPCGSGKKYKRCCMNKSQDISVEERPVETMSRQGLDSTAVRDEPFPEDLLLGSDVDWFDDDPEMDAMMEEMSHVNPIQLERAFAQLRRILESGALPEGADVDEELNEWMDTDQLPEPRPMTQLEEAQELMYDALIVFDDPDYQVDLAREALEISPDCADAYLLLAEVDAETEEQAEEMYQKAIEAGERSLGEEWSADQPKDLAGFIELFPYLRALVGMATLRLEQDRGGEAIELLERVLSLDSSDSQGARHLLLAEYLRQHNRRAARSLMRRFKDEQSAFFSYARALIAFQEQGNSKAARRELQGAVRQNPYFAGYLTNPTLLASAEPLPHVDDYDRKYEAYLSVRGQLAAWAFTPDALGWVIDYLKAHVDDLPSEVRVLVRR